MGLVMKEHSYLQLFLKWIQLSNYWTWKSINHNFFLFEGFLHCLLIHGNEFNEETTVALALALKTNSSLTELNIASQNAETVSFLSGETSMVF